MKITRLLIANRGEIARRIIRTCRQLGIHAIAIYSEADADMPFVREADSAVSLGAGTAAETYLDMDKVIRAAADTGADAIHPGYGFLSENTRFAAACEQAGIVFVGPPASAIELMGDKAAARLKMQHSGVPVLPGFDEPADANTLQQEADRMGYPLLIKPVAGGGGKGMHVVEASEHFADTLAKAQREARYAFGDDQVLLERYLPSARHVEVQVFADQQGNGVYLFERDCSMQRRHQKVIEEAPAPDMSEALRERMGKAAVAAALAVDYVGAGTVEFLLAPDGKFYFMEMNTRLQVEHPVTECVTGEDLVAWQLVVAAGAKLPKQQHELSLRGHAIEVRLYAEDPWSGFLPASGQIAHLRWPTGVRIDAGVEEGNCISSLYDPMIAKLISHGDNREQARQQLLAALDALELSGLKHNAGFLRQLLADPVFISSQHDTQYIDTHPELIEPQPPAAELLALAAAGCLCQQRQQITSADPWDKLTGWRALGETLFQQLVTVEGNVYVVCITGDQASVNGQTAPYRLQPVGDARRLTWGDKQLTLRVHRQPDSQQLVLFHCGQDYALTLGLERDDQQQAAGGFAAPMAGNVLLHHVSAGDRVKAGDAVITMEAMKMEHTLHAAADGTVKAYLVQINDHVNSGDLLVDFEADEA